MSEEELSTLKNLINMLINDFPGYTGQEERVRSFEAFKKYGFEKIRFSQKFLEKNYDSLTKTKPQALNSPQDLTLIALVLDSIRTLTKCLSLLEKDLKHWPFLCEEIRLFQDEEIALYKQDIAILENLSSIADKISKVQIVSDQILSDMHQDILALKMLLEKKDHHLSNTNNLVQAVTEDMQCLLKEICKHTATLQTYEALQKQIEKNPRRWNTYQDIFEAFQSASKSYLSLTELSIPHAYEQAFVFLDAYERFCKSLFIFLESTTKLSSEEQALWNTFSEKIHYISDFIQEKNKLKQGLLAAKALKSLKFLK